MGKLFRVNFGHQSIETAASYSMLINLLLELMVFLGFNIVQHQNRVNSNLTESIKMKISINKLVFAGLIATFITTAPMAKSNHNDGERDSLNTSCSEQTLHGTYSFSTMGNLADKSIALTGYIYFDGEGKGFTEFLGSTSALQLPITPPEFSYSQTQAPSSCIFSYELQTSALGSTFTSVSIFASPDTNRIQGISTHDGVNYAFQAERVSKNNLIPTSPLTPLN